MNKEKIKEALHRWLNDDAMIIRPTSGRLEDTQEQLIICCVEYFRKKCPLEVSDRMLLIQAALMDDIDYTAIVRYADGNIYETRNVSEEEQYKLKLQTR